MRVEILTNCENVYVKYVAVRRDCQRDWHCVRETGILSERLALCQRLTLCQERLAWCQERLALCQERLALCQERPALSERLALCQRDWHCENRNRYAQCKVVSFLPVFSLKGLKTHLTLWQWLSLPVNLRDEINYSVVQCTSVHNFDEWII